MTRTRNYRGSSRKLESHNIKDNKLVEDRQNLRSSEKTRNDIERHLFEQSIGIHQHKIKFDYSANVLSLRGNWKTRISVITLYLPFIVNKNKCKKFEELVSEAFDNIF